MNIKIINHRCGWGWLRLKTNLQSCFVVFMYFKQILTKNQFTNLYCDEAKTFNFIGFISSDSYCLAYGINLENKLLNPSTYG